MVEEEKSSLFFKITAIIGAVLILVGIAWLIAWNWESMPDFLKVVILVFSVLLSFIFGLIARSFKQEGLGRSLFVLGSGLYVLSLFLISQIYHLDVEAQWILLLAWIVIAIVAYVLNSPENILVALLVFFPWLLIEYSSSVYNDSVLGAVFLLLSAGLLLYSLKIFHEALNHGFKKVYRFWAVFYFLLVFYILSFQGILPILGDYGSSGVFGGFLVGFILVAVFAFLSSILFGFSKKTISIREVSIFVGVLFVLLCLILMAKPVTGSFGYCGLQGCHDQASQSECNNFPYNCVWQGNDCLSASNSCYQTHIQEKCEANSFCSWNVAGKHCYVNYSAEIGGSEEARSQCQTYNNQRESCVNADNCNWNPSVSLGRGSKLPFGFWSLWAIINVFFIGFIILILGYGQLVNSTKIVNLGFIAFVLEIVSRYIGFWMDLQGYVAFSVLAITGGILLIAGSWFIPKWRKSLLKKKETPIQKSVEK